MLPVRIMLLWLAIIPLAVANGFLRDLWLAPALGPVAARAASGIILGVVVLGWTLLTIPWLGRRRSTVYLAIGLLWLALTVAFEFAFGRFVNQHAWPELLRPYRFEQGDLWPLVLVVVALSPWLAARLRRLF